MAHPDAPTAPAPHGPDPRAPDPRRADRPPPPPTRPLMHGDDALCTPGAILSDRYRIVARLGKGGMGEVYRADDLKLGQPVALKFLRPGISDDPVWLERFRAEVRIARQVAHPNVCRVYDLGETQTTDGPRTFLSMEYIDGEDMASLLRRIGRLPTDKAAQVARQIGAGLSAAHALGVLHRDLKPANIMLDGRGQARITDFGIAGLAGEIAQSDIASGTPAYMAPEQLAGREVTIRSDLYSLGLVLYELFTGRPAFDQKALSRAGGSRAASEITRPSTIAQDIDPAVERVIMRCLHEDPAARPPSVVAVLAALPGGDPLRAALEAGETPSPELVAAAGERAAVPFAKALALVLAVVALTIAIGALGVRTSVLRYIDLPKPPAVLVDRAADTLKALGVDEKAGDSAWGILIRDGLMRRLEYLDHDRPDPRRYLALRTEFPSPISLWRRTSPETLRPWQMSGNVTMVDPPRTTAGSTVLTIDPRGRLETFAIKSRREQPAPSAANPPAAPPDDRPDRTVTAIPDSPADPAPTSAAPPADWKTIFGLAGLRFDAFKEVPTQRYPPDYADARFAWEGPGPDDPAQTIHVEAASLAGRPVWFGMYPLWDLALSDSTPGAQNGIPWVRAVMGAILAAALIAAAWSARRNVRLGRGDLAGAARLGWAVFGLSLLGWMIDSRHGESDILQGMNDFIAGTALPLLFGGLAWMFYLVLEPFVRRRDPALLVSWTRLLAGGLHDPLVGRDVLIGLLGGLGYVALNLALVVAARLTGAPAVAPHSPFASTLSGWEGSIASVLSSGITAVLNGMLLVLFFVAALALVRRKWIASAIAGFCAFALATDSSDFTIAWLKIAAGLIGGLGLILYLARFGLLPILTAMFVVVMLERIPITTDLGAWYAHGTTIGLVVLAALTAWGFWAARGGQWAIQ